MVSLMSTVASVSPHSSVAGMRRKLPLAYHMSGSNQLGPSEGFYWCDETP